MTVAVAILLSGGGDRRELTAEQGRALAAQRAEFDAAVQRHLAFIDELLADKKALADRADGEPSLVAGGGHWMATLASSCRGRMPCECHDGALSSHLHCNRSSDS